MTTTTTAHSDVNLATILLVAFIGLAVTFTVGFADSAVLHDAAHDTRHSIGFPCH